MEEGGDSRLIPGVRRAWALVGPRESKRLRLVALYGVLIAGLDTLALILIYALISLLNKQPVTGIAATAIHVLGRDPSDRYRTALILLAITSMLFVARSLLSVLGLWLTLGAANAAQLALIRRLLVGHARAPQIVRLEQNSSETLRTVMSSVDQVITGVVFSSVSLISNGAVAVAVAFGLLLSSPLVAVAAIIYFALIGVLWARVVKGGLARRGQRVQELSASRYQLVLQGLAAAKELQLRGRALFYAEDAVAQTRGINAAMRVAGVANGSLRYMLETSLVVGAVLVVGVAGLTGGHNAVLPAVGLTLAGAFRLLPALNQMLFLTNSVQFSLGAIGFVEHELQIFGAYAEPRRQAPQGASLRLQREVRLEEIGFRYPTREEPALRGISFAVGAGESFGIVGPTGSGKSTLLDVILGILEPDTGAASVDGLPMAECREPWQRSIGYVPQDVYLVDDTLRANVALGWYGDEIDEKRVLEAVRLAELDDVVAGLPDGLDTRVGERGIRLSGGQRQRVGLARALYTQPSVLVLDEATSNLDQMTERQIVDTLTALQGGVTMIVVTHRVATVRNCDRLLYLEAGEIRALGRFDDVSAAVPGFGEPMAAPLEAALAG
ncbi:MAG TPA: ABC transporter ATP-binding protein [Gaiellaceae bacterium]|nr:ABC transporter ATP-binding protein [Gaiellaceae bacterium]